MRHRSLLRCKPRLPPDKPRRNLPLLPLLPGKPRSNRRYAGKRRSRRSSRASGPVTVCRTGSRTSRAIGPIPSQTTTTSRTPQGGIPGDPAARNRARNKGPREERAPSRVTDPADGEIPFQPWARAKQQEFLANFFGATKPEYTEPLARCWPAGIPKSFYWHGYEIRQYPGYVLFLFNSGNRIIYLDGRPHLSQSIRQWSGDSRGRWEGNTLVVDVTNNNSKARFGRTGEFASENVHITERFIFDNDGGRYNYEATFDDPTVYTRTWTATIPARRYTVKDPYNEWHYEVIPANNPASRRSPTTMSGCASRTTGLSANSPWVRKSRPQCHSS